MMQTANNFSLQGKCMNSYTPKAKPEVSTAALTAESADEFPKVSPNLKATEHFPFRIWSCLLL